MVLTIELAAMAVGTLIAIWGAVFGVVRWVLGEFEKRDRNIDAAKATSDKKIQELAASIQAHKLYAAEHFATGAELARSLGRVEAAIERLTGRFDDILMAQPRPRAERGLRSRDGS